MKKKTSILLILMLFLVTSISLISFQSTNARGATPLNPPPTDPPATGSETWEFDNDTTIAFEVTQTMGPIITSVNKYYNISSIKYGNFTGSSDNFYYVQLIEMYFNTTTNQLEEFTNRSAYPLMNMSAINENFSLEEMYIQHNAFSMNPAFFIPYNGSTGLHLAWSAKALDKTCYSLMLGGSTTIQINTGTNEIKISSLSGIDYVRMIFYANGTLKTGELSLSGGAFVVNYTRIFDFNPYDEILWNVNVGDMLYYGYGPNESRFNITEIKNSTIDGPLFQSAVQLVIADWYIWNFTTEQWVLVQENITIGTASEDSPYVLDLYGGPSQFLPLVLSVGATGAQLAESWSILTTFGAYQTLEYGEIWVKLSNSSSNYFQIEYFQNGLMKYGHTGGGNPMTGPEDIVMYYKNMTIINGIVKKIPETYGATGYQVNFSIGVTADTMLLFASMHKNPINVTLDYVLLVIDVMVNDSSNLDLTLDGALNITIELPSNIVEKIDKLDVKYFNQTTQTWESIPFEILGGNVILISVNHTSVFALHFISDDGGEEEDEPPPPPAIPYGNYYLIFMALSIVAIIIYMKKHKF